MLCCVYWPLHSVVANGVLRPSCTIVCSLYCLCCQLPSLYHGYLSIEANHTSMIAIVFWLAANSVLIGYLPPTPYGQHATGGEGGGGGLV